MCWYAVNFSWYMSWYVSLWFMYMKCHTCWYAVYGSCTWVDMFPCGSCTWSDISVDIDLHFWWYMSWYVCLWFMYVKWHTCWYAVFFSWYMSWYVSSWVEQVKRCRSEFTCKMRGKKKREQSRVAGTQQIDKLWTWCKGFICGRVKACIDGLPNPQLFSQAYQYVWRKNNVDKDLFQLLATELKNWREKQFF